MQELRIGKSWFNRLLTNILMIMLLLAVLSAATFAWYSVANVATAKDVTFYAASEQEGGDLCIGWAYNDYGYELEFKSITQGNGLYPMIPTVDGVINTTTYNDFIAFHKATETYDELGRLITRLSSDYDVTPYKMQSNNNKTIFYIINRSNSAMRITLSYSIVAQAYVTGENDDGTPTTDYYDIINKFRCAIFTSDTTADNTVLRGIMSNEKNIHYGMLQDAQAVEDTPIMTDGYRASQDITFVVPANSYVPARAVAWFDGVDMKDDDGDRYVSLLMAFSGAVIAE